MPRKKRVRKKAGVKRATKKPVADRRKTIVLRNLILFVILFVLFLVLDLVTSNELLDNFFGMLTWITGFIAVAFLIIFLILWFMKLMKK